MSDPTVTPPVQPPVPPDQPSDFDISEEYGTARKNLPPVAESAVAKSADNIRFQAEFKARVLPEIDTWWQARVRR